MEIVSRKLLDALAAEAPQPASAPHERNGKAHTSGPFDIDSFIQRNGFELDGPDPYQGGRKWTFRKSPLCDHHADGPFLIQFANGALSAGCHHNSCNWKWEDLRERCEPGYQEQRQQNQSNGKPRRESHAEPLSIPKVICLADVTPKKQEWLWENRFPIGQIVDLSGDPGLGKSLLWIDIAARLTRGDAMPPHTAPDGTYDRRNVLLLTAEDDLNRTIRPRLDAAGADVSRVHSLQAITLVDCDGEERAVGLPIDIEPIERVVVEKQIAMIVVDVFEAHLADGLNPNSNADMRRALTPLARMCERRNCLCVLIRHLNKKPGGPAIYRSGGSIGISGAARAVFVVGQCPDDPATKILACTKINVGKEPPSLTYEIEGAENGAARIRWTGQSDVTANELLSTDRQRQGGKLNLAKGIITDILGHGSRGENEVKVACENAGVSFSTYKRARRELGVLSEKTAFDGQWMLTLLQEVQE